MGRLHGLQRGRKHAIAGQAAEARSTLRPPSAVAGVTAASADRRSAFPALKRRRVPVIKHAFRRATGQEIALADAKDEMAVSVAGENAGLHRRQGEQQHRHAHADGDAGSICDQGEGQTAPASLARRWAGAPRASAFFSSPGRRPHAGTAAHQPVHLGERAEGRYIVRASSTNSSARHARSAPASIRASPAACARISAGRLRKMRSGPRGAGRRHRLASGPPASAPSRRDGPSPPPISCARR